MNLESINNMRGKFIDSVNFQESKFIAENMIVDGHKLENLKIEETSEPTAEQKENNSELELYKRFYDFDINKFNQDSSALDLTAERHDSIYM